MEELDAIIRSLVLTTAVITEGAAALIVAFAVAKSVFFSALAYIRFRSPMEIRFALGSWLALTLELLLAADILRTAVAPTWEEIGKLGSIIVLRTALNFFLEREIKAGREHSEVKTTTDLGPSHHGASVGSRPHSPDPASH